MRPYHLKKDAGPSLAENVHQNEVEIIEGIIMKKKRITLCCTILSMISLLCCTDMVAYNWGYMQGAIDNRVAYFSAPAYAAIFTGVPFIIAVIIFAVIPVVISRRK